MRFFGLTPDDYAVENVAEVWPDNVQAVNAFVAMGTQWRCGPNGAYGLDYGVLPQVLRLAQIPRAVWPDVFESIRVLEGAALEAMHKD